MQLIVKTIAFFAMLSLPFVSALSSNMNSEQSMDIRSIKAVIQYYHQQNKAFPVDDESGTWFQKIIAMKSGFRRGRFGSDKAGYPLDRYGQRLIYEIIDGEPVVRSIGVNGLDDKGALDDWDSRWGANWGYWHKRSWTQDALGAAIVLILALATWLAFRFSRWPLLSLLLGSTLVSILTLVSIFDRTTSSNPLPPFVGIFRHIMAFHLLVAVSSSVALLQNLFAKKEHPAHLCRNCGYDISYSSGPCPECGYISSDT